MKWEVRRSGEKHREKYTSEENERRRKKVMLRLSKERS